MNPLKRGFARAGIRAVTLFCVMGAAPSLLFAQDRAPNKPTYQFLSNEGNLLYLGAGLARPLLAGNRAGREQSLRIADALAVSIALSQVLKVTTRERRPDGSSRDSFPSGHATAAFTIAAMQSHYHPRETPFWYVGAALIGESRVQLRRHYYHDVVAGGLLGIFTVRFALSRPRGIIIAPVFRPESGERGLSIGARF